MFVAVFSHSIRRHLLMEVKDLPVSSQQRKRAFIDLNQVRRHGIGQELSRKEQIVL